MYVSYHPILLTYDKEATKAPPHSTVYSMFSPEPPGSDDIGRRCTTETGIEKKRVICYILLTSDYLMTQKI